MRKSLGGMRNRSQSTKQVIKSNIPLPPPPKLINDILSGRTGKKTAGPKQRATSLVQGKKGRRNVSMAGPGNPGGGGVSNNENEKNINLKRIIPNTNIPETRLIGERNLPTMNFQNMPLFKLNGPMNKFQTVKEAKSVRRFDRKQIKMMSLVATQLRTEQSYEPTEWVVVWGAGMSFHNKKSIVFNFFDPLPQEVRFYLDKPYCTVHFLTKEHAEKAKMDKTGIEFVSLQPLLMGYLGEEPPPEDTNMIAPYKETWPKGLDLFHDFISEEEQEFIMKELLPELLVENGTTTSSKNHHVKNYGYEFHPNTYDIDINEPLGTNIPECLTKIVTRMIEQQIIPRKPEQLTLNYYIPGQGIPSHVDAHSSFETPIVSISLNSPTVMDFHENENLVSIVLPPRTLLVMDEDSRYQWSHEIVNRKIDIIPDQIYGGCTIIERRDRISLTFRLLRPPNHECNCNWPEMCDAQQKKINARDAAKIDDELVHKIYDNIAPHFDQTRHSPWPKVKDFIESIAPGKCLLDVGCGNGKYFNLTDYIYEVGTDMSTELLNISTETGKKCTKDIPIHCMRLPFNDNSFDATICISVLHHLSTKERRLQVIKEIIRVICPGGEGLIYAWAKNSRLDEVKSTYLRQKQLKSTSLYDEPKKECMIPLRDYKFPVHSPEKNFTHNDVLIPWVTVKDDGKTELHHRFYHIFVRGELDELIRQLQKQIPLRILDSYYDQGNWCVRFRKENP